MSKKFFTSIAAVAMVVVIAYTAFAKTPVSSVKWYGDSDKAAANGGEVGYTDSPRSNASGLKIPSNAHSADFPGLYFIWDSKQKDNGYLKVEAGVFGDYGFGSFLLTTKESNKYYDFYISPEKDRYGNVTQKLTEDGCYVFFIPKVAGNKNINMVFLDAYNDGVAKESWFPVNASFVRECELGCCKDCSLSVEDTFVFWLKEGDVFGNNDDDWTAVYEALDISADDVVSYRSTLAIDEDVYVMESEFTVNMVDALAVSLVGECLCVCECCDCELCKECDGCLDKDCECVNCPGPCGCDPVEPLSYDDDAFDGGISTDDGNLIISRELLGHYFTEEANGQGWISITVNKKEISGNGEFTTHNKGITIKSKALVEGYIVIQVGATEDTMDIELTILLFMENGKPVGAVIVQ